jgi:hypothetical protein
MLRFFILLMVILLLGGSLSVDAAEDVALEKADRVEILKSLFAADLNSLSRLERALPAEWLEPGADLATHRKAAEAQLLAMRDKTSVQLPGEGVDDAGILSELLVLEIQWLKLSAENRSKFIAEVSAREVSRDSEKKGSQLIAEAVLEKQVSTRLEENLDRQVQATQDQRTSLVLNARLEVERLKQRLSTSKKRLGEIQQGFAASIEGWKALESEITKALDRQNEDFIGYRPALRTRLHESNQRIRSRETFMQFFLGDLASEGLNVEQTTITALNSDTEETKQLIQEIHEETINLATSYEQYQREHQNLVDQLILWEKAYRSLLLESRGGLIERFKSAALSLDGGEPLLQEGRTVISTLWFSLWSFKTLYIQSSVAADKSLLLRLSEYAYVARVLFFVVIALVLLVKKRAIVSQVQQLARRQLSHVHRNWSLWISELLADLYEFLVLLLLGNLIIEFAVSLGFTFMQGFSPLLNIALIFFFGWGFIDFLRPIVSQRRFRQSSTDESKAMEIIFEFVPKLLLVFYLTKSMTHQLLYQWLNVNFVDAYFQRGFDGLFFVALYIGVWRNRPHWRLVAGKAANYRLWDNFLQRSVDRYWEPVILVFSGGLGVYLLTWRILKGRIGELEFARSFQAMVSRALLERRKRNATVRIDQARFPDGYLTHFSYETRAEADWHIERKEATERLQASYERWMYDKEGTTVLIAGDRGVGKSELLYQFLRTTEGTALECKLNPGVASIAGICEVLSPQLFGVPWQGDPQSFLQNINDLEPSIILLENLENSILRQVDGFDAFIFVLDLIMATSGKHLWLVTYTTYAWTIVKRAVPSADCFSQYIYLRGMNEAEIKQMVLLRHDSRHTLKLDFSNLSIDNNVKSKSNHSAQENERRRMDLYFRILWDYTGGNPRQALYFWKTSLSVEGQSARVDLFDVPEQGVLEGLRDKSLMLLSALVEHNGLTIQGLASVLNEPPVNVRRWIEEVMPYGIVYTFGQANSETYGWHIESFWISAVETYLEKRQLLFRGGLK